MFRTMLIRDLRLPQVRPWCILGKEYLTRFRHLIVRMAPPLKWSISVCLIDLTPSNILDDNGTGHQAGISRHWRRLFG